jgi:hypothetical protein
MTKDSTLPKGHRSHCKLCHNLKVKDYHRQDHVKENRKAWLSENPEKLQQNRLNKYSLKLEDYKLNLVLQGNACWICRELFTDTNLPHIDHDHKCCKGQRSCGQCVRGIICDDCNVALGKFKDNADALHNAILYLKGGSKFYAKTIF